MSQSGPEDTNSMGQLVTLASLARAQASQAVPGGTPTGHQRQPHEAGAAELVACLPTETYRRMQAAAHQAVVACPETSPRRHGLEQRAEQMTNLLRLGQRRDFLVAERQARGGDYEECRCIGQGGWGEQIVASVGSPTGPLAATDADGHQVLTWRHVCPCPAGAAHREGVAQAVAAAEERYRARRIARIAGEAAIPRVFRGLTIASWVRAVEERRADPPSVRRVLAAIEGWQRAVAPASEPSSRCLLLLAGQHGPGKSGLAAAIAQEWVDAERSVLFRTAAAFAADLRAAPFRAAGSSDERATEQAVLAAYQEVGLLVLDDLGTEALVGGGAERVVESLFLVLALRLSEARPTIVTTNLTPPLMAERFGARLSDRLGSEVHGFKAVLALDDRGVGIPSLRASTW